VTSAGSRAAVARLARATPLLVEVQEPPAVIVLEGAAPFVPPLPSRVYVGDGAPALDVSGLKAGPAIDDPDVGPLISNAALERALAAGGEHAGGLFVRPGVGTEAVAPLYTVQPLGRELPAAPVVHIHTPDLARAQELAARVRAGHVFVNGAGIPEPPFAALTRTKRVTILSSS
jgi:hypothetical protein